MDAAYQCWIDEHVPDETAAYGHCKEVVQEMAKAFPELAAVRGHYYCVAWGERGHWWLVDKDGGIIDPTASQFPSKGRGVYVPWCDGDSEPTGICPNCGEYIYDGNYFCSDVCGRAYVAFCSI